MRAIVSFIGTCRSRRAATRRGLYRGKTPTLVMQRVATWPILRRHLGFFALVAAGLESTAIAVMLTASVASGASSPLNVTSVMNVDLVTWLFLFFLL